MLVIFNAVKNIACYPNIAYNDMTTNGMMNNYDPPHSFCQYPISLKITFSRTIFRLLHKAETRIVNEEALTSMLEAKKIRYI